VSELVASGRIVDLILGFMLLEGLALALWHRRTGRGLAPLDVLANVLAGACLLLALRAALVGAAWFWIAFALSAALFAHLLDLARRWRR
jgi:hypothetical protein